MDVGYALQIFTALLSIPDFARTAYEHLKEALGIEDVVIPTVIDDVDALLQEAADVVREVGELQAKIDEIRNRWFATSQEVVQVERQPEAQRPEPTIRHEQSDDPRASRIENGRRGSERRGQSR